MGKRIVIALGGNALGKNLPEQMEAVQHTARAIVDLIEQGNEVIVVHGNGPQVGMIANAMTELTRSDPQKYIPCPLSVCGAMSQGYIGYDLQNALREEMERRGITRGVATVLTQVEVDPEDPAFKNPTKPIGSFMTEDEAEQLKRDRGYDFVEDSGRGYRRVVASPKPRRIVELDTISSLVAADHVVIACGGGGIPVLPTGNHHLKGAAAVIDKDFAAELLAESLDADYLVDPHRRGEGRRQLWQARPAVARRAHARDRRQVRGRGPVCPRLHAAQGPGCREVCRVQARPQRAHHAS